MTPDQSFARWVKLSLLAFAVVFSYFLLADLWMPLTPQSRVMHPVIGVTPQVSGQITQVAVRNNQHVESGELLFMIDARPYVLAVERAELGLADARLQNAQLDAAVEAAQAQVHAAQAEAVELASETHRLQALVGSQHVSRQQYEQTRSRMQAAQAAVTATQAEVRRLQLERGSARGDNLREAQARNVLDQARLELSYTEVRAEAAGVISNLQVREGTYARAGNELAALVTDEMDIIADFREKSLSRLQVGDQASVTFDAYPGQIFSARVRAKDAGTLDGQLVADGRLAAPEVTDRWVRNAQRQRLHLQLLDAQTLPALPSGARATVQLHPVGGLARWLGKLQIHAISLMHYIY